MSLASVLHTALSGMSAVTVSVEAVSHNLANARTNGYKAIHPVFTEQAFGAGVQVAGYTTDNSPGSVAADGDSTVELSNVDYGEELVELIMAGNHFSANAVVFDTADGMLDVLLGLGRR